MRPRVRGIRGKQRFIPQQRYLIDNAPPSSFLNWCGAHVKAHPL